MHALKNSSLKLPISLTGDRPTGPLHLGHLAGSLLQRVTLQETHQSFVMIADGQALTDNTGRRALIQTSIRDVLLDYLAVGIDPNKTTIFLQSLVPELFELTFHLMPLVTVSRLERNPTIRKEVQQKFKKEDEGENDQPILHRDIPVGFLTYPVSQSADILAFHADIVPVGSDQLPMIEQANELALRFNRVTGQRVLKPCSALLTNTPRLPGIDGKAKMGKSLGNVLNIGADEATIKKAIKNMYTDPTHLKISDPGKVEGNVVFAYLDAFHPNSAEVELLKTQYQKGGLSDRSVKDFLERTLLDLLGPIRERRIEAEKLNLKDILRDGSNQARLVATETLEQVREALGVGVSALGGL